MEAATVEPVSLAEARDVINDGAFISICERDPHIASHAALAPRQGPWGAARSVYPTVRGLRGAFSKRRSYSHRGKQPSKAATIRIGQGKTANRVFLAMAAAAFCAKRSASIKNGIGYGFWAVIGVRI